MHLYKITTEKRTFFTTASHVPHLYQKLKKDFGIYNVTSITYIK